MKWPSLSAKSGTTEIVFGRIDSRSDDTDVMKVRHSSIFLYIFLNLVIYLVCHTKPILNMATAHL